MMRHKYQDFDPLAQNKYLYDNLVLCLDTINLDTQLFNSISKNYYIRDTRQDHHIVHVRYLKKFLFTQDQSLDTPM
jgi:hypothetical protein